MIRIADIHCHILPYVDDGAEQLEESISILESQFQQGVRVICATPHLRKGMFETPDEDLCVIPHGPGMPEDLPRLR